MDKYLVIGFENELKAYEGSRALQDLQNEGSINLYAKAVIVRDASGKVTVKQEADMGPIGTAVGMLTGSLIGMIGGPVGMAVGATAGMYGGMVYDLANLGVGEDFLTEVSQYLQPGKAAVVAEVWEEWTQPVDTRMGAMGGVVFRRSRNEVFDLVVERDVEAIKSDLADLEAEYKQATGEAKVKLQKQIETTKAKLHAIQDGIETKIETSQKETEAKINALQVKAAKEKGERKAKLEARIAELKADHQRRVEILKQAWELIKEALAA